MLETFKDLWEFLKVKKSLWLFPLIIVMILFSVLVVLVQTGSATPFIYTLF
jgi:hypothetical protein